MERPAGSATVCFVTGFLARQTLFVLGSAEMERLVVMRALSFDGIFF